MRPILVVMLTFTVALVACGGRRTCKLDDPHSCGLAQVCEEVQDKEPMCFAPVLVQGKVFDLASNAAVPNARVSALDINGSPASTVVNTDSGGNFSLRVPSARSDEQGTWVGKKLTLRVSAQNYLPFPAGARVALPLDTASVTPQSKDDAVILTGALTQVGLVQLASADRGRPSVSGTVDVTGLLRGAMVVAESAGVGYSDIADRDGSFHIFNVPPGEYAVKAYAQGANHTPANVIVSSGNDVTGVSIPKNTVTPATVTGNVNPVAGVGGIPTSVVMVVKSTFNEILTRGEAPPGLRAPEPGIAPSITGAFSISGVPDGDYVMLAAFENDTLVRDPDPNQAGTELQYVTVSNGIPSLEPAFKITIAITIVSPGSGDTLDEVTGNPTFVWEPYSSAKTYTVTLYDSFGNSVWTKTQDATTGGNNQATYDGSNPLSAGSIYQWRLTALSLAGNPISLSEDLRGVFVAK